MRTKRVRLTGTTPLLMHMDNLGFETRMNTWRKNPANRDKQKAGDDRSPSWTWIGYVYHVGDKVGIPSDNLMTLIREGGAKVNTGKGKETFKKLSQSGLLIADPIWEIVTSAGKTVSFNEIERLYDAEDFDDHVNGVPSMGFELYIKRVRVGRAKHVRVRPLFSAGWKVEGDIMILDDAIDDQAFRDIIEVGGRRCGLCDWRPSSPMAPGQYGMFTVEIL